MVDDRLFFQIAAGLIPALLFGGLVSGAFRPTKSRSATVGELFLGLEARYEVVAIASHPALFSNGADGVRLENIVSGRFRFPGAAAG